MKRTTSYFVSIGITFLLYFISINALFAQQEIYVNVKVWVGNNTSNDGGLDPTTLSNLLSATEDKFNVPSYNTKIKFNFCTEELVDNNYYTDPESFIYDHCGDYDDLDRLDVYLHPDGLNFGQGHSGKSDANGGTRCWANADAATFPHELGHLFSLKHTDEGNQCFDQNGNEIEEGDGIPETPLHPDAANLSYNICEIDWNNSTDDCGNSMPPNHDPGNIIRDNLMGQVFPPQPCNLSSLPPKIYIEEQIEKMYNHIVEKKIQYSASGLLTCNQSSAIEITSDINSSTTLTGHIRILNSIEVNSDLIINNAHVEISPNSIITINGSGSLTVNTSVFDRRNCSGNWDKLIIESGAELDLDVVMFRGSNDGTYIRSTEVEVDGVEFGGGLTIENLGNLGASNDAVILSDITCFSAGRATEINNSRVGLWGPLFHDTNIEATNSELFIQMSPTPRVPVFTGLSQIKYISGARLQVDEARISHDQMTQLARIPIDVTQCDELTVCNSYFENSNAPTGLVPLISVNNATSFDIFQNIFEKINSDFGAINIINSPTGIIRNNYFDDNKIGIKVCTDALGAGFECNFHENSETAWKVDNNTQLGPQGILNIPARNKFLSSNNLDIENQDQFEFNYYYEDLNADRPTLMTAPEVNLIEATPIPDIICFTQSEIIDEWLQWETCVDIRDAIDLDNLICPHTGCTYHVPPPPSRTLDEIQQQQGGGQRIENQNLFNEKFGFISKEEITNNGAFRMSPNPVNDIIEITINPEYMDAHFIIYNTVGKKMLDGRLDSRINKISVDQLPSGIYNISILFSDGKPNVHQFIKM